MGFAGPAFSVFRYNRALLLSTKCSHVGYVTTIFTGWDQQAQCYAYYHGQTETINDELTTHKLPGFLEELIDLAI